MGLLGGLSVVFNNAGTSTLHRIHEWPLDEWNRIVAVNLDGGLTLHGSGVDRVLDRVDEIMRSTR